MIIPIILILSLGITVIFSSSQPLAFQQIFFALIGLAGFFAVRWFDYRVLSNYVKIFYGLALILLIVTWFIGFETRGSVRWISLGLINFQTSEFAKPVIILTLAWFWTKNPASWPAIFKSALLALPVFFLIFIQPDLGTSLTILAIWAGMLIASNISIKKILVLFLAGLLVLPVSWFFMHDYQRERLVSFVSPEHDPQGIGFHAIQSTIAVGSGGIFGRGLGRGTQSRLQFLPEFRTDFIFAFIAEELGFFGSGILLTFYGLILFLIFRVINLSRDRFGELICVGVLSMLGVQIFINVGMNVGILPITGITLPLLSYGGSSLLSVLICLGFVSSVAKYTLKKRTVESFDPIG
ncbi:MAG TPA: rod shape-determining protein RodA [Patescibacteria group bacterium]|nr:rod shape-determining protein RodA [Patescibacteria group bacterium]